MNFNLDDLVKFYASDLGKSCVKIIQNKLNKIVIKQNNQKILGFGFLLPYILNNDLESKINFLHHTNSSLIISTVFKNHVIHLYLSYQSPSLPIH